MNGLAFFDTNVLVYADDTSSPKKFSPAPSWAVCAPSNRL
jgi:hypothetical protein